MGRSTAEVKTIEDIEIYVSLPSGESGILIINPEETIVELKEAIKKKFGITTEEQHLFFKDNELSGAGTVSFYGLIEGATVRVTKKRPKWKANTIKESCTYEKDTRAKMLIDEKSDNSVEIFKRSALSVKFLQIIRSTRGADSVVEEESVKGLCDRIKPNKLEQIQSEARLSIRKPTFKRTYDDIIRLIKWMKCLKTFSQTGIPDIVLEQVCKQMEYKSFRAGSFLFRQGDIGRDFYIILNGTVSLSVAGYGKVTKLGPGSIFGEIAVINGDSGSTRTASAIADFTSSSTEVAVVSASQQAKDLLSHVDNILRQKVKFLNSISYFHGLPQSSLVRLAYVSSYLTVCGRTRIIAQGGPATHFYLLMKGQLIMNREETSNKMTLRHSNSKEHQKKCVIDLVEPPQMFGEECFLSPAPMYACSVTTVTTCTLLELPLGSVNHLIAPFEEATKAILEAYFSRLQRLDVRLQNCTERPEAFRKEEVADKNQITKLPEYAGQKLKTIEDWQKTIAEKCTTKESSIRESAVPLICFPNSGISIFPRRPTMTMKVHRGGRKFSVMEPLSNPKISSEKQEVRSVDKSRNIYPFTHLDLQHLDEYGI